MEENFVKLFGHIIVSIIFALLISRISKRSLDSFYNESPFPFGGKVEPILSIASIHIWSFVCAFFVGSPILLFSLVSIKNIGTFIAIIFFIVSCLRLITIISNRRNPIPDLQNIHGDYLFKELSSWLFISTGLLFFIYITEFSYFQETLNLIKINPNYLRFYPLFLFIGAIIITISIEFLGWGILRLIRIQNLKSG
jgi:hypothetical protein